MAFARQSLAIAPVSSLQDPWPWMWHDLTNNNIKRLKHISFHVWKQIETCTFCRLQPHLHLSTSIYIYLHLSVCSSSQCLNMFRHVSTCFSVEMSGFSVRFELSSYGDAQLRHQMHFVLGPWHRHSRLPGSIGEVTQCIISVVKLWTVNIVYTQYA